MTQWNGGYQPAPQQYPPAPQQYAPAPPPPPRRNTLAVALIAGLAVLAVLVVAIIVVIAVRRGGPDGTAAPQSGPSGGAPAAAGPVDTCLVGNWRQSQYTATFDLADVLDAGDKPVGTVKLSGGGRLWKIAADGVATEDFSATRYSGKTTDGRAVDMTFTGKNEWTLKTSEQRILFVSTGSTVEMIITVDGAEAYRDTVEPHNNPQPYTCLPNGWKTTSLTDSTATSTYDRV